MHEETERMGVEIGLTFDFARARRGNTFDAHRVLHMAHASGLQQAVQGRLMSAYFAEGTPIGDRAALAAAAGRGGARRGGGGGDAGGRRHATDVRADENEGPRARDQAVPFFVFDRR